jgi:hypothetical protein
VSVGRGGGIGQHLAIGTGEVLLGILAGNEHLQALVAHFEQLYSKCNALFQDHFLGDIVVLLALHEGRQAHYCYELLALGEEREVALLGYN